MLQAVAHALDLRRARAAAQLARQFVALREAGRAERMALRQQAARGIGDDAPAIGVVAVVDEGFRAAFRAKAERLVGDELVVSETIVQLDDLDVLRVRRRIARRLSGPPPSPCRSRRAASCRGIRRSRACPSSWPARRSRRWPLRPRCFGEAFRDQHGGGGAAGRRAGHRARHDARPDRLVVHHVLRRQFLAEDRQRIVLGVPARLGADFCEGRRASCRICSCSARPAPPK